ncbi:TrmB family transcriptional regulator [Natrarchaeobius halalkaliphilus]|uniref:TrmB family transcriptional regulator n=1 Tax=Natrarchaeobius halalkaliphilus TaxID=1679091 RepID=UPI001FB3B472|nr:helix-turn-helix domain-containing protein [Natrarchaeobius halalkaliphilus]
MGLSAYAARTFVALATLGEGTAQDVSDISEVPRTRVYDAVNELEDRGLVDVHQSTPKRFWVISSETTGRIFEQEYSQRVSELVAALDSLEPVARSDEQRGVWTVTGRKTVATRVIDFIESADEEVVYMTVGDLLTGDTIDSLRAASERGVSIKLGTMEQTIQEDIREAIPEAEMFESLWVWSDTPAGRLLMVDNEKTLVSVLADGTGDNQLEREDETAIWGSGGTNSLVIVLKAMFTWQLNGNRT